MVSPGTWSTAPPRPISRLLDNPEQARQMGAAGRDWVRSEWGWDRLGAQLRTALSDLHHAALSR
jgi:phosphatidylinositol alpha-1,6-mannosyltransferase